MNIHEYQGKELLKSYGIPVPEGRIAFSVREAVKAAKKLGGNKWVVKAQIHAGGRGAGYFKNTQDAKDKQGGVRLAESTKDVKAAAKSMLGNILVTKQTGEKGKEVQKIYIEKACNIERELYCSIIIDRALSCITFIASTQGGMDIEDIAKSTPEKIIRVNIDPATGMMPFHARKLGFALGLEGDTLKAAQKIFLSLYDAFTQTDASMIEINPLVVTAGGEITALDAKLGFDDNALFRHKDILTLRDKSEEDEKEIKASEHDLSYVSLDGNIGCMVNGAGLAMATMDIIKLYGGKPANFLDVGGGATTEKVSAAFEIILSDPGVKGILVNIFGGIMRCDIIAKGIVTAAKNMNITVPVVVRLEGTNVEEGKKILADSGINIISADDFNSAAKKITEVVNS